MRGALRRELTERHEDGTSMSVECSPDGNVLLLVQSPGHPEPAVFGFDPIGARALAARVLECADDAQAMRSKVLA